jgi:serine/threonine protein kinase
MTKNKNFREIIKSLFSSTTEYLLITDINSKKNRQKGFEFLKIFPDYFEYVEQKSVAKIKYKYLYDEELLYLNDKKADNSFLVPFRDKILLLLNNLSLSSIHVFKIKHNDLTKNISDNNDSNTEVINQIGCSQIKVLSEEELKAVVGGAIQVDYVFARQLHMGQLQRAGMMPDKLKEIEKKKVVAILVDNRIIRVDEARNMVALDRVDLTEFNQRIRDDVKRAVGFIGTGDVLKKSVDQVSRVTRRNIKTLYLKKELVGLALRPQEFIEKAAQTIAQISVRVSDGDIAAQEELVNYFADLDLLASENLDISECFSEETFRLALENILKIIDINLSPDLLAAVISKLAHPVTGISEASQSVLRERAYSMLEGDRRLDPEAPLGFRAEDKDLFVRGDLRTKAGRVGRLSADFRSMFRRQSRLVFSGCDAVLRRPLRRRHLMFSRDMLGAAIRPTRFTSTLRDPFLVKDLSTMLAGTSERHERPLPETDSLSFAVLANAVVNPHPLPKSVRCIPRKLSAAKNFRIYSSKAFGKRSADLKILDSAIEHYIGNDTDNIHEEISHLVDLAFEIDRFTLRCPIERMESSRYLRSEVYSNLCSYIRNLDDLHENTRFLMDLNMRLITTKGFNRRLLVNVLDVIDKKVFELAWVSNPRVTSFEQTKVDFSRMFLNTELLDSTGKVVFSGKDKSAKPIELLYKMIELVDGKEKSDLLRAEFTAQAELDENAFIQVFLSNIAEPGSEQRMQFNKSFRLLKAYNQEVAENVSNEVLMPVQIFSLPKAIGINRDTSLIRIQIDEAGNAYYHLDQSLRLQTEVEPNVALLDCHSTLVVSLLEDTVPTYSVVVSRYQDNAVERVGGEALKRDLEQVLALKHFGSGKIAQARKWLEDRSGLLTSRSLRILNSCVQRYLEMPTSGSLVHELYALHELKGAIAVFVRENPGKYTEGIDDLQRTVEAKKTVLIRKFMETLSVTSADLLFKTIDEDNGAIFAEVVNGGGDASAAIARLLDVVTMVKGQVEKCNLLLGLKASIKALKLELADALVPELNDLDTQVTLLIEAVRLNEYDIYKAKVTEDFEQALPLLLDDISNNSGLAAITLFQAPEDAFKTQILETLQRSFHIEETDSEQAILEKRAKSRVVRNFFQHVVKNSEMDRLRALTLLRQLMASSFRDRMTHSLDQYANDLIYMDFSKFDDDITRAEYARIPEIFSALESQLDAGIIKTSLDAMARDFYVSTAEDFSPKKAIRLFNSNQGFKAVILAVLRTSYFDFLLQADIADFNVEVRHEYSLAEIKEDDALFARLVERVFQDTAKVDRYCGLLVDLLGTNLPFYVLFDKIQQGGDISLKLLMDVWSNYSLKLSSQFSELEKELVIIRARIQAAGEAGEDLSALRAEKAELVLKMNKFDLSKPVAQGTMTVISAQLSSLILELAKLPERERMSRLEAFLGIHWTDATFSAEARALLVSAVLDSVNSLASTRPGLEAIMSGEKVVKGEDSRFSIVYGSFGKRYELLNTVSVEEAAGLGIPEKWITLTDKGAKIDIGSGSFGRVRIARDLDTGEIVAVKKVKMMIDSEEDLRNLYQEIILQQEASSGDGVVPIYDVAIVDSSASEYGVGQVDVFMPIIQGRDGLDYFCGLNVVTESDFEGIVEDLGFTGLDVIRELKERKFLDDDGHITSVFIGFSEERLVHRVFHCLDPAGRDSDELDANPELLEKYMGLMSKLKDLAVRRSELQMERIMEISRKLLVAVSALHSKGIYHRDLKPENFIVDDDGNVKIIDFGYATKHARTSDYAFGSPAYLPPEVVSGVGEEVDLEKVDAYAIGLSIYQLVKGLIPKDHASLMTDDIPEPLKTIIEQLTNPNPGERKTIIACAAA